MSAPSLMIPSPPSVPTKSPYWPARSPAAQQSESACMAVRQGCGIASAVQASSPARHVPSASTAWRLPVAQCNAVLHMQAPRHAQTQVVHSNCAWQQGAAAAHPARCGWPPFGRGTPAACRCTARCGWVRLAGTQTAPPPPPAPRRRWRYRPPRYAPQRGRHLAAAPPHPPSASSPARCLPQGRRTARHPEWAPACLPLRRRLAFPLAHTCLGCLLGHTCQACPPPPACLLGHSLQARAHSLPATARRLLARARRLPRRTRRG